MTSPLFALTLVFLASSSSNASADEAIDPVAIAVPVVEGVAGAALLLVAAPAIAATATDNFGDAFLLALSAYPGAFAVATAMGLLTLGIVFVAADEGRRDDCGLGQLMNSIGYVLVVVGVIGTILAPLAFWATIGADESITGHVVDEPARPILAATVGATAGVAVLLGGAYLHEEVDAIDEFPAYAAMATLAAGVGVVGATTAYVLAR